MALVPPIKNTGFALFQNSADKWSFATFAGGKEYLSWDAAIDVKPDMGLCFFGTTSIIGSGHRKDGINQGTIDCHQLPEFGVILR